MKKIFTLLAVTLLAVPGFGTIPLVINNGTSGTCTVGSGYTSTGPVDNTTYDTNYESECYFGATSTFTVSDPDIVAGNTYTMYLHFAEIYFTSDGARVFHVEVEGTRILENFDIHAVVGDRHAVAFRYDVVATVNGSIDITFVKVTQNPKISSIEIRPLGDPSALPTDSDIQDLTINPFPVEWMDMDISADNGKVRLDWSTAWESNNLGFEIEMNTAGGIYEPVGFVEGAGTTQDLSRYTFTTNPLPSNVYGFRIKQLDLNGNVSYSPTLELTIGNEISSSLISLYPNPATETMIVKYFVADEGQIDMTVNTMTGQTVLSFTDQGVGIKERILEVSSLSAGIYFVEMRAGAQHAVKRLIVR